MPRHVRNFWIELDVSGRSRVIETGPRRVDGGFRQRVYIRDEGGIYESPAVVEGVRRGDKLRLTLCLPSRGVRSERECLTFETNRDEPPEKRRVRAEEARRYAESREMMRRYPI